MASSFLPLIAVTMLSVLAGTIGQRAIVKRSAATNPGVAAFDYPDYASKYDEYPVVVPKRAALLFDQLMVALQKVVDNQGRSEFGSRSEIGGRGYGRSVAPHLPPTSSQVVPSADEQTMDLQRRGQAKGRVYWRCYFNAVTCFKRK